LDNFKTKDTFLEGKKFDLALSGGIDYTLSLHDALPLERFSKCKSMLVQGMLSDWHCVKQNVAHSVQCLDKWWLQ
jgi:hypothetical protein